MLDEKKDPAVSKFQLLCNYSPENIITFPKHGLVPILDRLLYTNIFSSLFNTTDIIITGNIEKIERCWEVIMNHRMIVNPTLDDGFPLWLKIRGVIERYVRNGVIEEPPLNFSIDDHNPESEYNKKLISVVNRKISNKYGDVRYFKVDGSDNWFDIAGDLDAVRKAHTSYVSEIRARYEGNECERCRTMVNDTPSDNTLCEECSLACMEEINRYSFDDMVKDVADGIVVENLNLQFITNIDMSKPLSKANACRNYFEVFPHMLCRLPASDTRRIQYETERADYYENSYA